LKGSFFCWWYEQILRVDGLLGVREAGPILVEHLQEVLNRRSQHCERALGQFRIKAHVIMKTVQVWDQDFTCCVVVVADQ